MLNIQKYTHKIFLSESASWNKLKNILWHLNFLFSFQFVYDQPITFWAWLSKNVGVRLGKRPYDWEQNRAVLLEPSIPKMLQVGSLQPPGHDIGHFFQSSIKVMTLKSFIYRISCGFTNYSRGLLGACFGTSKVHPRAGAAGRVRVVGLAWKGGSWTLTPETCFQDGIAATRKRKRNQKFVFSLRRVSSINNVAQEIYGEIQIWPK